MLYPLALKTAENKRLGGIKLEIQEFKNSFQVMISDLGLDIERKFEKTNKRLQELNGHLKTNIDDQMNESVMSIKNTIIDALKEGNDQLRNKVELLEKISLKLKFLAITLSNIKGEITFKFRASLRKSLMKN